MFYLKHKYGRIYTTAVAPKITEVTIMILVCNVCGYEYDTEAEGEMPEDYTCPVCGVDKTNFSEI